MGEHGQHFWMVHKCGKNTALPQELLRQAQGPVTQAAGILVSPCDRQ
jgi:hypothetical protein